MGKTLRAIFFGVAAVAFIITLGGTLLLQVIRQPASTDETPVEFVVDPGSSTSSIAADLAKAGIIRQPLLFTLLVRAEGLDGSLQAGRFQLRPAMTMSEVIAALQYSRIEEVQLTIVEGSRIEEIAEQLGAAGLANIDERSFLAAARSGDTFRDGHFLLGSLPDGASLEGYLFPDTYRFAATATVTEVVEIMLDRFDGQYTTFEREVQVTVSVHELVTMASIVQREAVREQEMPRIASVFWNRLRPENAPETGGGRLQADPTVQYVLGQRGGWWPKLDSLSANEINGLNSPYNTRAVIGLPPGPISNPGIDALRAAAVPDSANYLYFVASCTDRGAHNFATTFEEFQRFEQEYLQCTAP